MDTSYLYGKWASQPSPGEEVVITGISGRFPESNNVVEFKDNLFNKRDMVTDDGRRWKIDSDEIPQRAGKIYNIDKIDAGFFELTYRQANAMEPSERKFLETAIEAILDAGVNPSELEGSKTGVFVGVCHSDSQNTGCNTNNISEFYTPRVTGFLKTPMSHHLSYHLKLKGPSLNMDTACSSALHAVDFAFSAIRQGRCDAAIVGGTNLVLNPIVSRSYYRLGALSIDGACKAFDEKADGYAKAEAVVCILLQKAKDARRIYSQILHVKSFNEGFKSLGISSPSAEMHQRMIHETLEESSVSFSEVGFVEAHGTGTKVGDPLEIQGIDSAIAKKRNTPLLIGSVKSNMGHSEGASGMCEIAKILIAIQTGYIAPNLHLNNLKKGLEGFEKKRLKVVTELTRLNRDDAIFGLNNFGFGGSITHLLLRKFKKVQQGGMLFKDNCLRLVCVSGRTKNAVLKLLNYITSRQLDYEYVSLLHQIFKTNVSGHNFRGFTIISKNGALKANVKRCLPNLKVLYGIFGTFERGYKSLGQYLMDFPCFKSTIQQINCLFDENFDVYKEIVNKENSGRSHIVFSFAVQIGIIEIFKLLKLEIIVLNTDLLGCLITAYYNEDIDLVDAVFYLCETISGISLGTILSKLGQSCYTQYKTYSGTKTEYQNKAFPDASLQSCDNIILNISDRILDCANAISFADENFLEVLGRLYQEGYNLQLNNIYPSVHFPVRNDTPMIAPLIEWDWYKSWYTWKYHDSQNTNIISQTFEISTEDKKHLLDHVVEGRNLLPATEYLTLVWKTFCEKNVKLTNPNVPIMLEDCRWVNAVILPKKGFVSLLVSIDEVSGLFEIVDKESLLFTGKISLTETPNHRLDISFNEIAQKRTEFLDKDEFYRELNLRGFNFGDMFQTVVKCNLDASAGLVKWEDNFSTFLDGMLQLWCFKHDTRLPSVPINVKSVKIDKVRHLDFAKRHSSLCPVYYNKVHDILTSGGIEISGMSSKSIVKRKWPYKAIMERCVFVPNKIQTSMEKSLSIIVQIILENSLEDQFKAVEIIDDFTKTNSNLMMPIVSEIIDTIPLVVANLIVSSKTSQSVSSSIVVVEGFHLNSSSSMLLVVASKIFQRPNLFHQILNALKPNGFLLTREEPNFTPHLKDGIRVITEHHVGDEKLILVQKVQKCRDVKFMEILPDSLDWIPKLQKLLREEPNIVLYSQNSEPSGIIGLVKCLRLETGGNRVRCFLISDEAPKFNSASLFYKAQMEKQMAINVYKNKQWGTIRHFPLQEVKEVEGNLFSVQNVLGDLSTVAWVQGSPSVTGDLINKRRVFICYSALNFKDVRLASGGLIMETHKNRVQQESLLGMEYSGFDLNKRRVMGIMSSSALATEVIPDDDLLWQIPDHWSLLDASTIPVVYSTVVYILFKVIKIKPGMSILIHSATGGIGLAALNICLYHKLKIYVTVGSADKSAYLKKFYPQIPESCIGNSRDTSFEIMINKETQGVGVDIVLNSLSEEKLDASIRCTKPGGNFLAIGKFDASKNRRFNSQLLEQRISFHNISFDKIIDGESGSKRWIVDQIYEGMKLGYVKPLPRTIFQYSEITEAFQYFSNGNHIGKVVIRLREEKYELQLSKKLFKGKPRFVCDSEKTYIVVGGLGGFGLELADWLCLRGAKKMILVSRQGIQTGYQQLRINIWRSYGVTVQISTRDLTIKQGCVDLITDANKLGTVDGIFNVAVVLEDALFEDQNQIKFSVCMASKSQTTYYLDKVARERCPQLNYFVAFSSLSCRHGNAGQTNYAMANSMVERICEKRKSDGLPVLAIQWAAIGDVGVVAKLQKNYNQELSYYDYIPQKISSCLEVLDQFLAQDNPVVSSNVLAKSQQNVTFQRAVDKIAYILGIKEIKHIDRYITFAQLGLDSITVNEIVHILKRDFDITVTSKEFKDMTFSKLMEMEGGETSDDMEKIIADSEMVKPAGL